MPKLWKMRLLSGLMVTSVLNNHEISICLSGWEKGARGTMLSIAFANAGATPRHRAPRWSTTHRISSSIVSKSIASGGKVDYRGQVTLTRTLRNWVFTSSVIPLSWMTYQSDTIPFNVIHNSQVKLWSTKLRFLRFLKQSYYLMSRGLSESEATEMIVMICRTLSQKNFQWNAVELSNRLISYEMEGSGRIKPKGEANGFLKRLFGTIEKVNKGSFSRLKSWSGICFWSWSRSWWLLATNGTNLW